MQRMSEAVNILLAKLGLEQESKRFRIVRAWPDLVGQEMADRCQALHIKGSILWVGVSAPVWGQQISLHKYQLLSRIARTFGKGLVKDIRTVLLEERNQSVLLRKAGGFSRSFIPQVKERHQQKARELTGSLNDEEMKRTLNSVVASALAAQEDRSEKGWLSCQQCGAPYATPEAMTCFMCLAKEQSKRVERLRLLLMQVPWCDYGKATENIADLTREEYVAVKEMVAASWESAASRLKWSDPSQVTNVEQMLEMLRKGTKPEDLPDLSGEKGRRKARNKGRKGARG